MSIGLLPAVGECSYNGHTFSAAVITRDWSLTPVPDPSGRTAMYNKYGITLEDVIQDKDGTDSQAEEIRRKLSKWGGEFVYSGKGLGDIHVNGASDVKDVNWGPKVEGLSVIKLSGKRAFHISLRLSFCIPDCKGAVYEGRPMAVTYRMSFDKDKSGYVTIRYSGTLRIPQSKWSVNDKRLHDNADDYLDQIIPALLPGYRRDVVSRELSESKCDLSYSITDTQMPPFTPPPGVVEVTASHSINSTTPSLIADAEMKWEGTVSAQYEVARGVSPDVAWQAFWNLFDDRAGASRRMGNICLVRRAQISAPQIYGRQTLSVSASYTFTSSLNTILQASGLFRPPPDSDWDAWSKSMYAAKVFDPRGTSQVGFDNRMDAIIDLCPNNMVVELRPRGQQRVLKPGGIGGLKNPWPPAGKSWLRYRNFVTIEPEDSTVELKALPPAEIPVEQPAVQRVEMKGGFGNIEDVLKQTGAKEKNRFGTMTSLQGGKLESYAMQGRTAEMRTMPTIYVRMIGEAVRAGWEIPCPQLVKFGGMPVVPKNREGNGFAQKAIDNWFGVPVFAAAWDLRYLVLGYPLNLSPDIR